MSSGYQSDFVACVESACAALDAVEEYGINEGDAAGLLVLHGLAMYARDTARAASSLLSDGRTMAAAALARVVIEHAVLAQWLKADPEVRAGLFLQQSEIERARWFEVVLAANFDMTDPLHPHLSRYDERDSGPTRPKNVAPEFQTVKNLFGDTDNGRQFYLTYRNLSRFVHPSVTTFVRYTTDAPLGGGRQLVPGLQQDQDAEAVAFYLASATVMCALPYLEALGEIETGVMLCLAAEAAHIATSLD